MRVAGLTLSAIACAVVGTCLTVHADTTENAWRMLSSSAPYPPALGQPIGVYDPIRDRVLVADVSNGLSGPALYEFRMRPEPRWSILVGSGVSPGRQASPSVLYDPIRDRLLLIGGYYEAGVTVWALSLAGTQAWERIAATGRQPRPRAGHSTVYDASSDRVLLCGGYDRSYPSQYLSDVWQLPLSSAHWDSVGASGAAPPGREGHGALFDPVAQRMLIFGGHYEGGTRGFRNDLWALQLGAVPAWTEIQTSDPIPGARSAFGFTLDPIRHRAILHGGVNAQSGIEPDDLWALTLGDAPAWTPIVPADTLRGRSYPVDVYDPVEDELLACGGAGMPQWSSLSLSDPARWRSVLPLEPLVHPGSRSEHAVLHDSRRDRFVVVGGRFSPIDSAVWILDAKSLDHWQPRRAGSPPYVWSSSAYSNATVYDSLGDRLLQFDGHQAWATPASDPRVWTPLGPAIPYGSTEISEGAAVALDTRRNRLIVCGGWYFYPHSGSFSVRGVHALSLGPDPLWSALGVMPQEWGAAGHAAFYDHVRDRLILTGGLWRSGRLSTLRYGSIVWVTPMEPPLNWSTAHPPDDGIPPGPPIVPTAFDPASDRIWVASDTMLWVRGSLDPGPWTRVRALTGQPRVTTTLAFDPIRNQLLAPFAREPESEEVQLWALAVGSFDVTLESSRRTEHAIELEWYSITCHGRPATLERRVPESDWRTLGPISFDPEGYVRVFDPEVQPGLDYTYRVSVVLGSTVWHSTEVLVPEAPSTRLALYGARPNPAFGDIRLAISLPATGPARLDVFDVRGRRRLTRDVGLLGAGRHIVRLNGSEGWPPGMYYARLRRGVENATTRVAKVR